MTDALTVDGFVVRPLGPDTWEAFSALAERHNGMGFGGCWCTFFHPRRSSIGCDVEPGKPYKEFLVQKGMSHAALVFDGELAVAWCQFGPPEELPNIYHRKEYDAGLVTAPDYRLTCIFVDKAYRKRGLAEVAVKGALELIARAGGGIAEGYPRQVQPEEKIKAAFLYDGTRSMFEKLGFTFERPKGTKNCVMTITVPAAPRQEQG